MQAATAERLLRAWLVLTGLAMLSAALAVFMPRSWMAWAHQVLGLGAFPEAPIAEYLARLCSAVYALIGAVMVVTSRDVRRLRPVVVTLAWGTLAVSAAMVVMVAGRGMPLAWLLGDLGSNVVFTAVALWLLRRVEQPD